MHYVRRSRHDRRGAIGVFLAFLIVPLLALVAFSVDHGFLLKTRTDLQRVADSAALAGVQALVPEADGSQDLSVVRETVRNYVTANLGGSFSVPDADIQIGRFDPATIYTKVDLLDSGIRDTVRVTLRRDKSANGPVSLYFIRILGRQSAEVSAMATAVLQKAKSLGPGADVLPIAVPLDAWDNFMPGDTWNIYADGKVTDDTGESVPGNWGTVDIGDTNNSTSDLNEQIVDGLSQSDLDNLYGDGRISSNDKIEGDEAFWANADTGLSSGIKHGIQLVHGKPKLVPIYSKLGGKLNGNNLEYFIIGWGAVTVVDSTWNGSKNTKVQIKKSHMYDGDLLADPDLSVTAAVIEGAYTSPALVE